MRAGRRWLIVTLTLGVGLSGGIVYDNPAWWAMAWGVVVLASWFAFPVVLLWAISPLWRFRS